MTTKHGRKFREPRIEYHRILPQLYFGYERMERYSSYAWVATTEKAVLDMVYFGADYKLPRRFLDRKKLLQFGNLFGIHGGNRGRRVKKWVEKMLTRDETAHPAKRRCCLTGNRADSLLHDGVVGARDAAACRAFLSLLRSVSIRRAFAC
ncbi:MAG: hypothetical protein M1368_04680 [Thaumarchaeota archaeon]|nr:hypothetical protein [Nitrososphaerota archaeon]